MATLTRDVPNEVHGRTNPIHPEGVRSSGATAKLLVALAAAVGTWQILIAADPAKAAVQVLLAAGVAVLVGTLLFAREVIGVLRPPVYAALVALLVIWLALAYGVTQWQWGLLPG